MQRYAACSRSCVELYFSRVPSLCEHRHTPCTWMHACIFAHANVSIHHFAALEMSATQRFAAVSLCAVTSSHSASLNKSSSTWLMMVQHALHATEARVIWVRSNVYMHAQTSRTQAYMYISRHRPLWYLHVLRCACSSVCERVCMRAHVWKGQKCGCNYCVACVGKPWVRHSLVPKI